MVNLVTLSVRQKQILSYVQQTNGVLSSSLLSDKFNVSVQTIRKDMNELSDKGLVRRVHGGISLPSDNDNLSFSKRELVNVAAKQGIAQSVAREIPKGCSIFLGIGTTPKQVAHALLDHPGLTVVTNNINAALTLSRNPNIEVYLAGGIVRPSDEDTVGETATDFYRQFNIKIGIVGVGGLNTDQQGQLLDFTPHEASLTRAIITQSSQCWLVVDQSKLTRYAPIVSAQLSEIDRIFTDQIDQKLTTLCYDNKVDIVIAN
ncbi:DeoR/GlpR family DNA-binding transcription regulator [Vibrio sp. TH_r3]|uniref:DeoR/GlpR family DNA-binding transcription regulator n=1 Tax=Vibrio sp. TH_r3 TaxID=3082084 RepID=UPI002955240E|nr:DeoR/GlpR family DNA-binding transcription regulator [Vibrio sp. TH_r3]MDV7104412.1 DeoR/GlpR family DNA-binding transcription regulator [Vibrio sp. TH_r3]